VSSGVWDTCHTESRPREGGRHFPRHIQSRCPRAVIVRASLPTLATGHDNTVQNFAISSPISGHLNLRYLCMYISNALSVQAAVWWLEGFGGASRFLLATKSPVILQILGGRLAKTAMEPLLVSTGPNRSDVVWGPRSWVSYRGDGCLLALLTCKADSTATNT
jgi:hypothetical protein